MIASDTRHRLVRAAEQLFRTQGYSGTGLKELTAAAAAPWGSLYHFFPGGKAELAAEAMLWAGGAYGQGWRRAFAQAAGPGEAIEGVFRAEARILEGSDYRNGCPVAAMTLDIASTDERLRRACAEAFRGWLDILVEGFAAHGADAEAAEAMANFVLATIEGAIVLSRAAKSPGPLHACGRLVRDAVDAEAEGWSKLEVRAGG
ncbi:MAG TPA: TetR/AcrR family transcriptional regulator [Caulobacteraceae bacterium]|jgi:AcrR family transcriptional regulator|nr:TetR/AcrR family transcriptional regulator [Caulobacteraceae bacterium]